MGVPQPDAIVQNNITTFVSTKVYKSQSSTMVLLNTCDYSLFVQNCFNFDNFKYLKQGTSTMYLYCVVPENILRQVSSTINGS